MIVHASSIDKNIPYFKIVTKFVDEMDKERKKYAADISQADKQIDFLRKSLKKLEIKANEDLDQALSVYKLKLKYLTQTIEELEDQVKILKYRDHYYR